MGHTIRNLALVLMVMGLFGLEVSAQSWTSSGAEDTVFIKVSVRMIGASWSIDTLDDGWDDDSAVDTLWQFGSGTEYDSFFADIGSLDPCSLAIPAYWLENLGGISLDIMVRAEVGPTWRIHPLYYTCDSLSGSINYCGVGAIAMIANGVIDDFRPTDMNKDCIPMVTGSWAEVDSLHFHPTSSFQYYPFVTTTGTHLVAEDPIAGIGGEGTYRRDNDQMELYFYITPPAVSSATVPQYITFWVKAKVTD
ncbi:MAG TPA: hypothetical protein ENG11_05015 [candidate division Zixibacteria bacterium]|nr:hypothetical protein [candidate division Zixibacteria bacterium]